MSAVLRRSSLRHFSRHPLQGVLAVLGIALGVAVVVAVDLATLSARRAFELSAAAVSGSATHQVTAGSTGLPDGALRVLRLDLGVAAAPVVDVHVTLRGPTASRAARLLGVDPFGEAPFRSWLDATRLEADISPLLTQPGALLLARELAESVGAGPGDSLAVMVGGVERAAWVAGLLEPADALGRRTLADVLLADISVAQELSGRLGVLDRIDLRLAEGEAGDRDADRVRMALPWAAVVTAGQRAEATAGMTRAFTLNLTAFSLITLLFGALLIYDTMTFSVVQRRELIGLLRAVGVTRGEISRLFLREALAIGLLATVLGIAAGILLGQSLLQLVARTINDLYFAVNVTSVSLTPLALAKGVLLGLGATLLASLPPVREATSTTPRQVLARSQLEERTRRGVRRAALAGLLLLVSGLGLVAVPSANIVVGFVALFAVIFAAALLAPLGTVLLTTALRPVAARLFGGVGTMAVRGVVRALSRTGPAVAALMVAVAAGAAVALMVSSFRGSVERWLSESLQADVYVSTPSGGRGRAQGVLDPDLIRSIASAPGVQGITRYREIEVPWRDRSVQLVAIDLYPRHRETFTFLGQSPDRVWPVFDEGGLLISESLAYRNTLEAGDTVTLATMAGPRAFPVAGIYRDYSSEFGVAFLRGETYRALWQDPAVSALALWLEPGVGADALISRLTAELGGAQQLIFRSNRGLREATLDVFDRTFTITRVLRLLALIVAFVGVLSTLMALQLERTRELAMLRATGFTPAQVWGLISAQTGVLGLAAGLLAIPVATLLSWLLIHVVNRRSFGWTMDLRVETAGLLEAVLLAVAAALLAGAWPAWLMARTPPGVALREE